MTQVETLVRDAAHYENNRVTIYSIPAFLDATAAAYRSLREKGIVPEIVLHHLQAEDPQALLSSNAVDFLIMFDRFMEEGGDESLERIPFAREGFCAVCGPEDPMTALESVTLRECRAKNVLFGLGFPGLGPRPVLEPGDQSIPHLTLESYHDAVLLGEGILILPTVCARTFASDLRMVPISDKELRCNIELVYKKNRPLSAVARAYAEEIRAIGAEVFGGE